MRRPDQHRAARWSVETITVTGVPPAAGMRRRVKLFSMNASDRPSGHGKTPRR